MIDKKNNININKIEEILGIRPENNSYINRMTYTPFDLNQKIPNQLFPKSQPPMDPWQKDLTNLILYSRRDILVNVMPAAGKTRPVVNSWIQSFYQRHKKQKLDKILWVCPTVQLANQVYNMDLKEALFKMLSSSDIDIEDILKLMPEFKNTNLLTPYKKLSVSDFNLIQNIINKRTALRTGMSSTGSLSSIDQYCWFAVCTYSYAVQAIKMQMPDIVVIDELQQYVPIQLPNNHTDEQNSKDLTEVIVSTPKHVPIILLTGSMNKESANFIINTFNNDLGRNFQSQFNAEGAKNRAAIYVFPHEKLGTQDDIVNNISKNIHEQSVGNAYILFSVKSEDEIFKNKRAVYPIANKLIQTLPWKSIRQIAGVDPTIKRIESYMDYNPNDYDKASDRSYHKLNLTLVKDKNKYKDNPDQKLAYDFLANDTKDPQWIANRLQIMLNQEFIEQDPKIKHTLNNYGENKSRPDPLLAKSILCGFGYLAGGSDRDRKLTNEDINLVQVLFQNKKIFAILASDMIGVGTTLIVHNLYLPTLQKMGSGRMGQVDDSSLVQLINRVGRSSNVSSKIFCPPEDFQRIFTLLNTSPLSSVAPIPFGDNNTGLEKNINSSISCKMLMIKRMFSSN